ncbi:MAG: 2-C-methyl-D-erythritol 4-phosphate cytidylyltransferase [Firmicutes bacterium]|nr:2-C-methyl-D-erythritol 4-phosphate cytidylyltransferase [Bacillota bacterium]
MKKVAIVFAGGVGQRMGASTPKQFLKLKDKEILVHTLEKFQNNDNVDAIVICMLASYIDFTKELVAEYNIDKVVGIVPGGETGQLSIYNGVKYAHDQFDEDTIVLIHDGVRPFITDELINENISVAQVTGSCISCVKATETFLIVDEENSVKEIPARSQSLIAKAPQTFRLGNIYGAHQNAIRDNKINFVDSSTLMNYYGNPLSVIETDYDNIKITTPKDIALAESIYDRLHKEKGNEYVKKPRRDE